MKRIFAFTLCLGPAGLATAHPAAAAGTAAPMAHEKTLMNPSGMKMEHGSMATRAKSCSPMIRDYFWLDYSRRMDMGRNMRVLHIRYDDFPPRPSAMDMMRGSGMGMGQEGNTTISAGRSPVAADGRSKTSWRRSRGNRMAMRPDPHASDNAPADAVFWLETPDSAIHHIDTKTPGKMSFPAPQWGLHKVFAYLDAGVRANMRRKHFTFYSFYSHGDKAGKKPRPVLNGDGYWEGAPEFDLTRIYADDRQRYSTQTGQRAVFRISLHGRPVKGACVVMVTQKGWRNAKTTDENGKVSFFLIRENETAGGWQTRRRAEKYLVAARHEVAYAGEVDGKPYAGTRYLATMSLRVRPSQLEWESKSTAFVIAAFTLIAAGAAIAIRRRRRAAKSRKGA